jgi:hypothetical protein
MTEKHIKTYLKLLLFGILLSLLAGCTPEGDDDFSLPRDKYRGDWIGQDDDGASYNVVISPDPSNSTQVIISNYFALKGTVTAIVTETTITVTNQKMQGISGTYWCEGRGLLTRKHGVYTITWSLYAANNDETTSIYTKQ